MSRRLRLLEFSNQWELGGTEKSAELFMKYLDRSRFELLAAGWRGGERAPAIRALGIELHLEADPRSMADWIRSQSIDIVHFHRAGVTDTVLIDTFVAAGVPCLVEHNIFAQFDPSPDRLRIQRHIFVSDTSCAFYRQRCTGPVEKGRLARIYNPVEITEFDRFDWPSRRWEAPIFGRLSRADELKWHPINIEILPHVRQAVPRARFFVIGLPPAYRARIEQLGVTDMVTEFPPTLSLDQIASFLSELTVFTHGSAIGETFGMGIAEAMAAHLPVITHTGGDGAQCELITDGHNGFVVDPKDVASYAERLIRLLKDPELKEILGQRSYERARSQFDARQVTRELEATLLEAYRETVDHP